jgi:nucleoside 2-deoxyribosyltransferase
MKRTPFIYLASPYSHPDATTRHQRFIAVCRHAGWLMEQGHVVFCPIAHSHPIGETMVGTTMDHEFWMRQDLPMLARASKLIVLKIGGWRGSKGVAEEIFFARRQGIPIEYHTRRK